MRALKWMTFLQRTRACSRGVSRSLPYCLCPLTALQETKQVVLRLQTFHVAHGCTLGPSRHFKEGKRWHWSQRWKAVALVPKMESGGTGPKDGKRWHSSQRWKAVALVPKMESGGIRPKDGKRWHWSQRWKAVAFVSKMGNMLLSVDGHARQIYPGKSLFNFF